LFLPNKETTAASEWFKATDDKMTKNKITEGNKGSSISAWYQMMAKTSPLGLRLLLLVAKDISKEDFN